METNTIIEGDKLIAEFMGVYEINGVYGGCLVNPLKNTITSDKLKYYFSWDWLMPAVKKIIPPNGWQVSGVKYQTAVINALTLADIEKVWFAVVEFIKWYNANK